MATLPSKHGGPTPRSRSRARSSERSYRPLDWLLQEDEGPLDQQLDGTAGIAAQVSVGASSLPPWSRCSLLTWGGQAKSGQEVHHWQRFRSSVGSVSVLGVGTIEGWTEAQALEHGGLDLYQARVAALGPDPLREDGSVEPFAARGGGGGCSDLLGADESLAMWGCPNCPNDNN